MTGPIGQPVNPFLPIAAPPLIPTRYGLYAAATPIDEPHGQWEFGTVWDDSDNCTHGGLWQPCCSRFEDAGTNALRKVTVTVTFTARPALLGGTEFVAVARDNWTGGPITNITVGIGPVGGPPTDTLVISSNGVESAVIATEPVCGQDYGVSIDPAGTIPPNVVGVITVSPAVGTDTPCSGSVTLNFSVEVAEPTGEKAFSDSTFVYGDPFVVYDGRICPNYTEEQLKTSARNRFALSEQRQVEQMFWRGPNVPALANVDTVVLNRDATGLGVPVSPSTAVALLEGCLQDRYLGTGLIHAPRWTAGLFNREYQIAYELGTSPILRTSIGTGWVFGSGYPGTGPEGQPAPTTTPAPGQAWVYATGQVVIRRSPVIANAVRDRTGCVTALAERTVVLGIQCNVKCAVLVDFTLCDCPVPAP